MRFPIRYQFLLPIAAVATVSLLAIGMVNHRLATVRTRDQVEDRMRSVVEALTQRSYPLTESVLKQMRGLANAEFVLADADGNAIRSSNSLPDFERPPTPSVIAHEVDEIKLGEAVVLGSKSYLHGAVWVNQGVGQTRRNVLHILFLQDDFNAAWWSAFAPPLVVGAATLLAVAIVVQLVARRLSTTLDRLSNDVERLADGDFSDVDSPVRNDEAFDLANAINQTARRLRDYENELRRTERLQAVSMIGAGLAHEMRNAATGCRLAIDLHECDHTSVDESLEVARRQLTLMEGRLRQILQAGKPIQASQPKPVDLRTVVEETLTLVDPAIRHAHVTLEWVAPEEPCVGLIDPDLLGQAIMNLVLNALDAAAKVSAVEPDTGWIRIELSSEGGVGELRVVDNGAGPKVDPQRVFEPFVTEKSEGVGLGLAVTKSVVESSGGEVGFRREEGTTVFCVRLPLTKAEACHV